jgi:ferredoxin-like protein FixX
MEGAELCFSELVSYFIIWVEKIGDLYSERFNFDEVKSAELHEKHRSSSVELEKHLSICCANLFSHRGENLRKSVEMTC